MLLRNDTARYSFVLTPQGKVARRRPLEERIRLGWRKFWRALYLVRLDFIQQTFGLTLGHLWLVLEPALQAATYYFLLAVVFAHRQADSTFAFFLVAIIFWRSHAMLVTASTTFLTGKGWQYVDQGFGLGLAFLEFAAQEIALFLIRFVVLLVFLAFTGFAPSPYWLAALFVAACMFCFTISLTPWLAMIGVLFKDAGKLIGHVVWLWWYLSPGLYSTTRIPQVLKPFFACNPFVYIIPAAHSTLLKHSLSATQLRSLALIAVVSCIALVYGLRVIRRFGYHIAHYV